MTTEVEAARAIQVLERQVHQRVYLHDPAGWVEDCIDWDHEQLRGERPAPYQLEGLDEMIRYGRLAVRSGHSSGKTTTASWAILWAADVWEGENFKVPTTASASVQLRQFLWPEVHRWVRFIRWDVLDREPWEKGVELLDQQIKLETGAAFAISSADPTKMEGTHGDYILFVFDEAKGIRPETWDAAEGAFAGAGPDTKREAYALAYSTPGPPSGRFYAIHSKQPGLQHWRTKHVTIADMVSAGRTSAEFAREKAGEWGEQSAMYRRRVLGEFATDESSVIPLEWVEAAQERWKVHEEADPGWWQRGDLSMLGVDVGDGGDPTVLAPMLAGFRFAPLLRYPEGDTMQTTARVEEQLRNRGGLAIVDAIGIGAGVVARLRELELDVLPFVASESARGFTDKSGSLGFANCLTGDAVVRPVGGLVRIYRSLYDGPLFRVKMALGGEFTATPNHNVLTQTGWVPVEGLSVGDQLIHSGLGQGGPRRKPEVNDMPPSLRELYGAASENRLPDRVRPGRVDFHGDRPRGDVDVVTVDGELSDDLKRRWEHRKNAALVVGLLCQGNLPSPGGSGVVSASGARKRDWRAGLPAQAFLTELAPFGWGQAGVLKAFGFRPGAKVDACVSEHAADEVVRNPVFSAQRFDRRSVPVSIHDSRRGRSQEELDTCGFGSAGNSIFVQDASDDVGVACELLGETLDRGSSRIQMDYVLSIDVIPAGGQRDPFVYTLETSTGAYEGGVVHRNCRAASWWHMREILDPMSGIGVELPPDDMLTSDLTTPRWKEGSGNRLVVEPKEGTDPEWGIKRRLGRSTDSADAIIQSAFGELLSAARSPKPTIVRTPPTGRRVFSGPPGTRR